VTLLLLISLAMRALDINFESARVARPDTVSRFVSAGKRAFKRVFEDTRAIACPQPFTQLR